MAYYEVQEDEQLLEILFRERGRVDVEAVTSDAKNESLFKSRTELILRAGDQVWLPDDPPKLRKEKVAAGETHRFQAKGLFRDFSLVLANPDGSPLADMDYDLVVEGYSYPGKTDGSGTIKARIPTRATEAVLRIGDELRTLRIGGLDPLHTITGVQARLYNLGYAPGPIDGVAGPRTSAAVAAFQGDHKLEMTGRMDDDTLAELKKAYGF